MPRDLEHELNEFDGRYPPAWKPAAGDVLVGRIVRYGEGRGKFGPIRTAILERSDGSRVSLWIGSEVLLDQFRKARPKAGETVGVKYLGRDEAKGYHRWHVLVDREEEPSFEALGGETDDRPQPLKPAARATDTPTPFADKAIRRGRPPASGRQPARAGGTTYAPPPPHTDDDDPFTGF